MQCAPMCAHLRLGQMFRRSRGGGDQGRGKGDFTGETGSDILKVRVSSCLLRLMEEERFYVTTTNNSCMED